MSERSKLQCKATKVSVRCTCHHRCSACKCKCKCVCKCECKCGKSSSRRPCPHHARRADRTRRIKRKNKKRILRRIHFTVKHLSLVCPDRTPISIRPVVKRYFFQVPEDIHLTGEELVLHPHQFADDTGETAVKFMDFGQEGYFNLYVNGVLQEGKLYQASADALKIAATGQSIIKGTPIILESVGFHVAREK